MEISDDAAFVTKLSIDQVMVIFRTRNVTNGPDFLDLFENVAGLVFMQNSVTLDCV